MLDHLSIYVRDLSRSLNFYDASLGALGIQRSFATAEIAAYGGMFFWLYGGNPDSNPSSSRQHYAFSAKSRAAVDGFYAAALAAGGTDNGAPGVRAKYAPNYYAAYVIDPDGYKLEAVCYE